MNPTRDFDLENFEKVLSEIEKVGKFTYLRELEDKIIRKIVGLVEADTDIARAELKKIEKIVNRELSFTPRNQLLISALKNSIQGALSVAKLCLLC